MLVLKDVISRVFRTYGFDVIEGNDISEWDFLASKDSVNIAIKYSTGRAVTKADILNFLSINGNVNINKRIFITTEGFDGEAKKLAKEVNILLWDKERFQKEIGKAVLLETGTKFSKGTFESMFNQRPVERCENIDFSFLQLEFSKDDNIIKPKITQERAKEIASNIVRPYGAVLELVPYFLCDYRCEILVDGKLDTKADKGMIAVNAITKKSEKWDWPMELSKELDYTPTKLKPKIDIKKASEIAKEAIINLNTKVVSVSIDKGSEVMFETRRIEPKDGALEIDSKGLFYLPTWYIEGSNGAITVNAVNGAIIKDSTIDTNDAEFV